MVIKPQLLYPICRSNCTRFHVPRKRKLICPSTKYAMHGVSEGLDQLPHGTGLQGTWRVLIAGLQSMEHQQLSTKAATPSHHNLCLLNEDGTREQRLLWNPSCLLLAFVTNRCGTTRDLKSDNLWSRSRSKHFSKGLQLTKDQAPQHPDQKSIWFIF